MATMPRPSGKSQKIAQNVIPGLRHLKKGKVRKKKGNIFSEVEIRQTNNINNKKEIIQ
jgi:hypothetical protein